MPPAAAIAAWTSAVCFSWFEMLSSLAPARFASAAAACSFRLSPPPLRCSTSSGTSDMLRLSSADAASARFIIAGSTLLEIARACSSFAKRAAATALAACRAATFNRFFSPALASFSASHAASSARARAATASLAASSSSSDCEMSPNAPCTVASSALIFGSCKSLSPWLVTVTSGLERKACACSGVFVAQLWMSIFSCSSDCSAAFWMQTIWCRSFLVPTAGFRPSGVANCMDSQDSN